MIFFTVSFSRFAPSRNSSDLVSQRCANKGFLSGPPSQGPFLALLFLAVVSFNCRIVYPEDPFHTN